MSHNEENLWPEPPKDPVFPTNRIYLKTYDLSIDEEELKDIIKDKLEDRLEHIKKKLKQNKKEAQDYPKFTKPEDHAEIKEDEQELLSEQKRTEWKLRFLSGKVDYQTNYFDNRLLRAREVPITNFVQFNRAGFAKCLWHNESTGSLKYYPKDNKTHCFGCQAGGDVVDVVMQMHHLGFKEAVAFLLNEQ